MTGQLIIKQLGLQRYSDILQSMRGFTQQRTADTPDELWLLEHFSVFTQGLAGKPEHILNSHQIPVVQTDRGGQITYHGPGQLVAYPLINLSRLGISIRDLVRKLEHSIIDLLLHYRVTAQSRTEAPGVYIDGRKICSIGLRVSKGCSFHGLALNISMDLTPFSYINPCGFKGLSMAQMSEFTPEATVEKVIPFFITAFQQRFGYTD